MKTFISFTAIFLLIYGCNSNPTEFEDNDFSVFLTMDIENNSPSNIQLDRVILEDESILSIESIEYYEWSNHRITFSNAIKDKIKLKEPLFGRYFIVTASNQRIYWGLFTDDASSMSCNNPVIRVWSRSALDTSFITNSFVIDRAYPEYIGYENDDLRNDLRIYNVLKESGKLK